MNIYTVFYANKIFLESDRFVSSAGLPDGAWIKFGTKAPSWYLVHHGGLESINPGDVPKEIRMLCLIMGLEV